MNPRRRLALSAAALLVALLAAAYAGWWQYLAARWRKGIEEWAASRTQAGWTVSTGAIAVAGFPGAIRIALPEPSVKDGAGDSWAGPKLTIIVSPIAPLDPRIEAPGAHRFALAGREPASVTATSLDGRLAVARGAPQSLVLSATGIAAPRISADSGRIEFRRLPAGAAEPDAGTLGIELEIDRLALPADLGLPLDRTLAIAHLAARIEGALPKDGRVPSPQAWRDAGGVLDLDSATLDWPPLIAAGSATLALDRAMQPELSGSFTLRGADAAIDRAAAMGAIPPAVAAVAKLALDLASKKAADGTPEATVPVTIQDRVLTVGPAPLARLPELDWRVAN